MGTRFWPCLVLVLLLATAGCGQVPASPLAQGPDTSPGPAYLPPPGAGEGYPTPPPPTSGPIVPQTEIPWTAEPTPAPAPVPTPWPTPAMTPIPVASPPYIPGLGQPAAPFQVFFARDNTLWILDSRDGQAHLALDVKAVFSMTLQQRWQPISVSPDGQRLAVALTEPEQSAKDVPPRTAIYLYDRATGRTDLLVEGATDPRWAPDGRRIAYQKEDSVWIMELTTGSTRKVFSVPTEAALIGGAPYVLGWSPDGEWVGILYNPKGWDGPPEALITRASGSGETIHLPEEPAYTSGPVWAPNGSRVLYVIADLDFSECMGPAHCGSLWIANADGSGRSQLLPPSFAFAIGATQWSPDGQWVVFSGASLFERPELSYSLWLIKADGTTLLRLTDPYPAGNDLDPMWTPDGTRVIFVREGQGIWTLDLIDGSLRQLYPHSVDFLVQK
jgi:Tol biopolymer transport system component